MFKKVLVANRGEIAVRVIRTLKDLGVASVAVFSDDDRGALHTRLASEAHDLGGASPGGSYLDQEKILSIARASGAEAVHPGYGFLSENPDFSKAVADSGLKFVGPGAEAMRSLGDKLSGRAAAVAAGLSVAPGSPDGVETAGEALDEAERIGFPVILKASGGGGGIGMRIVHSADNLAREFALARATADAAFKGSRVFVEKFIERARHIEFQFIVDTIGRGIYFPERECSVQRRYQKLIEESPSPAVDEEARRRIGEAVVRLANDVGYENAGTAEFLLSGDRFYFNEVNARLQVEHPVTEMVSGVDIVELQLLVAAGEPLPFEQADVRLEGSAIECRINAEDVHHDFNPSPGAVLSYREPAGPFVRVDGFLAAGDKVSASYDSLIAKLITWGGTRETALLRMRRALSEFDIRGAQTTLPFHRKALAHPDFEAGRVSTRFVEESGIIEALSAERDERMRRLEMVAAALAAQLHSDPSQAALLTTASFRATPRSEWSHRGREMSLRGGRRR